MDALSEFFDRIQMKGGLFFAGKIYSALDVNKPEGTAFVHVIEKGGLDLVRFGYPPITIKGPCILLCPSSCRYKLETNTPDGVDIICASFEFGATIGRSYLLGVTDTLVFSLKNSDPLLSIVQTLFSEYRGQDIGFRKSVNVLFEYIFVVLIRKAVVDGLIFKGSISAVLNPNLSKAITAIHNDPGHDWTVKQLAGLACMSRSKFSALFLKVVGVPPITYLAAWRVKRAQDLIKQGVKLKNVAASVGYSSQAALSRAFSQEVGLPPGEWLRQQG